MPIVSSYGALTAMTDPQPSWGAASSEGSVNLYSSRKSYGSIYRRFQNVRTCADFLAFNVAHLGLHVYRRLSDTDRERLADHPLAQLIKHPNPWTTQWRLWEALILDLGVYSNAYWIKVRVPDQLGIMRLPPKEMHVEGDLYPTSFVRTVNGRTKEYDPRDIVYFRWSVGFDEDRPQMGLSRLETLQRVLAEESAAGEHRESFWGNAARIEGVVTRPKEKQRYTKEQAQSWREQWQAIYAGGAGAGRALLLQDGETFTPTSWSSKDSEYVAARKLAREEYASANHIPQPFVGILDHATFSNIREQHKHLYQDTLGPPLEMIQQELEAQVLPEYADQDNVYCEFNIDAKMAGTPEERASSIQMSTGRPWRTVNEARALENLPRIDDPELDTVAPQQGGPSDASANPTPPANAPPPADDPATDAATAIAVGRTLHAWEGRIRSRLANESDEDRFAAYVDGLGRWTRELAADLMPLLGEDDAQQRAIQAAGALRTTLETEALDYA
jgi:HK97 family phage portal protein